MFFTQLTFIRTIIFRVTVLFFCALMNAADKGNVLKTFSLNEVANVQKIVRYYVLDEPDAECPNNMAWRDDLNTETLGLLHCVSKTFKQVCESIIDEPRQKIMEHHKNLFEINKNSILFNKYGQWSGIGLRHVDDALWYIFFTHHSKLHCVRRKKEFKYNDTTNKYDLFKTPQIVTASTMINYRNQCAKLEHSSVFFMKLKNYYNASWHEHIGGSLIVILPDEKEVYKTTFSQENRTRKKCEITDLQETTASLIRNIFEQLSPDQSFWDTFYQSYGNEISIKRITGELSNLDIHLDAAPLSDDDRFFNTTLTPYKQLSSEWIANPHCTCTTNIIDSRCQKEYENLLVLATQESAYTLKKRIHEHFINHHIVHEIKDQGTQNPTQHKIYTRHDGCFLMRRKLEEGALEEIRCWEEDGSSGWAICYRPQVQNIKLKKARDIAEEIARGLHIINSVLFYTDDQKPDGSKYFHFTVMDQFKEPQLTFHCIPIKSAYTVQDAYTFTRNSRKKAASLIAFLLCAADNNQKLMFCDFTYSESNDKYSCCTSFEQLTKTFHRLIDGEKSLNGIILDADPADIRSMIEYICRLQKESSLIDQSIQTSTLGPNNKSTGALGTQTSPYTGLHFKPLSTIEYQVCINDTVFFKPKGYIDKLWYKLSPFSVLTTKDKLMTSLIKSIECLPRIIIMCAIESAIEVGAALYCLMLPLSTLYSMYTLNISSFFNHTVFMGMTITPIVNICSANNVYDAYSRNNIKGNERGYLNSVKKVYWSRVSAAAFYVLGGYNFFTGLQSRTLFSLLPFIQLCIHAYNVQIPTDGVEIPFKELYNSWPAKLRRAGWLQ